ncbi:MAG: L,D-transpeptidase family protein [Campylobacterota bacterium]|nr:L,D-transpeptidase family protein [Campylobacterota bacterium]
MALLILTVIIVNAEKFILIDLDTQMAYAYENGYIVLEGRVSTGKEEHRTPTGYYTILQKKRYHKSNLWPKPNGGAKMNYMLRLTNTGIAMHLGPVPRWPASHGCIRMKNGFAQQLWRWADIGTEVEVSGYPPERVASRGYNSFFDENYRVDD